MFFEVKWRRIFEYKDFFSLITALPNLEDCKNYFDYIAMSALIFPNKPFGPVPTNVHKTFFFLKNLPDGHVIWHHLTPWQAEQPDFLVINPDGRAIVIKVSDATPKQWQSKIQMLLMGDNREIIGEHESDILLAFKKAYEDHVNNYSEEASHINGVVIFPNLSTRDISKNRAKKEEESLVWLGKEYLDDKNIKKWGTFFGNKSLDGISYHVIRELFTPESVVLGSISAREPSERNIKAGLTDFLLDYDQEEVLKHDLELPEDKRNITRDFQTSIVNGVAGSGKTLILLYRLRLLYALYPNKQFLVLTHNRALIRDIQWKYYQICGDLPENIEWKTFSQWLNHHWPLKAFPKPIGQESKKQIIREIHKQLFSSSSITESMLLSEIDWITDQVERSREAYLLVQRRGRGFRLSQQQRSLMFDAYEKYLSVLKKRKMIDWGLVSHGYWNLVKNHQEKIPKYDVVLIDETQFFAPIWFEIITHMLEPKTGCIFMVADPTQGFLNRGISWKSMGLEVRNRTHILDKSYRTTKEILTLATIFYRQRVPVDDAEEGILEPNIFDMPEGVVPQLIPLSSKQDEITRVSNEVELFVKTHGIPKSQILILHANWQGVESLIRVINRKLGDGSAMDPRDHDPGDYIRVTTLNRGTGIESPIVFFVGMSQLMEAEQSLRISDEEREKLILENSRRIYMAMTRAGHRLVITYAGKMAEDLLWMFQ